MSRVRSNFITNRLADGAPTASLGLIISGVTTSTTLNVDDKIVHTGDTNTAIRFPAADTITAETSGSERLRITSTGLVGIGTDTPAQPVHISRGSAVARIQSTDASTSARLEIIGANDSYSGLHMGDVDDVDVGAIRYYHAGSDPNHMSFRTSGSEKVRITSAGKIGIGTDSPDSDAYIHIVGQDNGKIIFEDNSNNGANLRKNYIGIENSDNLVLAADEDNLGSSSAIKFRIDGDEKVRIASNGRVGIGTDSPASLLDIVGGKTGTNLSVDGTVQVNSNQNWNFATLKLTREASNTANTKLISFLLDGDSASATGLYDNVNLVLRTDSAPTAGSASTTLNAGLELTAPSSIRLSTNGNERFRIDSSGRITKPDQPGFGASQMNGWTNLSGSTYAVTSYNIVHHNYGSHFNSSNGRFTAPVDGRYMMHAIGMGVNNSAPHIAFGINNSSNGGGPSRGGTDYGNNNMWSHPSNSGYWVCITHILDLSANDYVRVYTYDWNSSNDPVRCYFYGYLLG